MVKLDILSDPICPWCFIGKTLLDRALAERPNHPFKITWHPFQLNPDMPTEGMDRREYLEAKFGGPAGAAQVYGNIEARAKEVGLDVDFAAITRTPNTVDAHRAIHWAGIEGKQLEFVHALFAAYFCEGRNIGDHEVLADLADGVGLDAAIVVRLLKTEEDVEMIRTQDAEARKMGVNSVPTFLIGGQHAVPGAQPTELWVKVIDEIAEQIARGDAS